ncbi:CWF19-like protein 2 [Venturia canescens]|uniref:CWF19-like protein 2 n=1 Tax=Venturia canescens TaxID=32260 RepID=UPI001C9CF117|nr:CWF19-like protein 2 [Venturia canescens]
MSFINFESSKVKEAERQALREAREKILTNAEIAYRKKQAQVQRAKERGDDQWMLPSVEAKLSSTVSSKRKKKKEKKNKKAKKSKKKKKHKESSSDSASSGDETEEWVEKGTEMPGHSESETSKCIVSEKPLERDEWMNLPGSFLCSSRDEKQKKKEEDKKETCILDKPGQSSRELNPYWKDGGMGLPEMKDTHEAKVMDAAWLKKSLRRAQEQAEEEGKSLEEVAAARWGSLDKIHSMIEEAEKNSRKIYGSGNDWRRDSRKYSSSSRKIYDDHESNDRRAEKGREKRRKDSRERDERSRKRSKSPSLERDRKRSSNIDDGQLNADRKKITFMKPGDEEYSSASSSRKSSSSIKRWQKPNTNKSSVEQQRHGHTPKNHRERSPKSSSDESQSDHDDRKSTQVDDRKSGDNEEIITEAEMNKLGAKIVKAEIMGDMELAAELKAKLELARTARKNKPAVSSGTKPAEEENVILTKINAKGMARPLEPRSLYEEPTGGRRKAKKVDTHESGKRVRYFADDDKFTLQEMFQREKGETSAENDATFVKMASKSMDMDELFEQRITRQDSDAKQDERDRTRAIKAHKKLEKSLDNCRWCFDSKNMLKHLIVAMGSKTYVSLPSHVSMTVGHCILAPIHHVSCQTQLDEDVWEELQNFKKALTKMFMKRNEFPVFFEMSVGQHRFPHMQLECIPLPDEVGSMAPIYFKKALLECETEWSTNKKVIDLSNKDVRQAIPKGLPYFSVNFGNHGGFAHVIEDEKLFPKNFAQEIIGGILDLDHSLWRKPRRENFDQQRKKVLEFATSWKPYDFTTNDDS